MSRTQEEIEELEQVGIEIDEDAVEISDDAIDTIFSDTLPEDALANDEALYADDEENPVETPTILDEDEIDDLDDDLTIDEEDDERISETQRMWIRAANHEDRFNRD